MTDVRLLYVTTPNPDVARRIGRALIDQGLAACANILPQMESMYRWDGELTTDSESILILKTQSAMVKAATEAVVVLHPYDTPCVLSLNVESGAEGYLQWLKTETHPKAPVP